MTTAIVLKFVAAIVAGYLLGSIPFGVIIGRKFSGVDVRDFGSRKMGTTNVWRVAGQKAAALVFFLDLSKGGLAVVFAWFILRGQYWAPVDSGLWWILRSAPALAALAAIAGHIWPVFLKFKGGRGVATFYGGLLALCPPVAFVSGPIAILGAGLTRFMSLASILGAVTAYLILVPLTVVNRFPWENLLYGLVGSIAIIATHHDNIVRLYTGKERRLGEKAENATGAQTSTIAQLPLRRASGKPVFYLRWSRQNLHE